MDRNSRARRLLWAIVPALFVAALAPGCSRDEPAQVQLEQAAQPADPSPRRDTASLEAPAPALAPTEPVAAASASEAREVAAQPLAAPEPVRPPQSRVFGRVVDQAGAPLAGVRAGFKTYRDWSPDVQTPQLDLYAATLAFECATDAEGKFALAVPTPTSEWITFELLPDQYHQALKEDLIASRPGVLRVAAGDNDFGEFTLGPAGAVRGRVLDGQSAPLAGTQIRMEVERPRSAPKWTRTDAEGVYHIPSVPAGSFALEADHKGFSISKLAKVDVVAGRTTDAPDIVLAAAPTISGVVVDEQDAPIAGAAVHGWPVSSGAGAFGRTDAEGRFSLALRQVEPHHLQVEAEGFAKQGDAMAESYAMRMALAGSQARGELDPEAEQRMLAAGSIRPGTSDVRIVMKRSVLTTFVVLDARTSQPVTRYGVKLTFREVELGDGKILTVSGGEPEYALADHPAGEFECAADPGRHGFRIEAPGYSPLEGTVSHESPQSRRCVVRLGAGGAIGGRAVLDGQPVAGAAVALRDRTLAEIQDRAVGDENEAYWSVYDESTSPFWSEGISRNVVAEADGAFRFEGLEPGDYRIEILSKEGDRLAREPVNVAAGAPTELGDVELLRAGSLRGRVLAPPGFPVKGIEVALWAFDVESRTRVDAEGRFVLEHRPPGRQHVVFLQKPGSIAAGETLHVEIAPGETKEVEFDLRGRAGCFVLLEVLVNGQPARGIHANLASVDGSERTVFLRDDDAREASWQPAIGLVDGTVYSASGLPLASVPRVVDLAPGAQAVARFECACGSVLTSWPEVPTGERVTNLRVTAKPAGAAEEFHAYVSAEKGPFASEEETDVRLTGPSRVSAERVVAGECEWSVWVLSESASEVQTTRSYSKKLTIRAGETVECAFTEADRVEEQ